MPKLKAWLTYKPIELRNPTHDVVAQGFGKIFGRPFMQGTFKKISGHGMVPLLLGVLIAATGKGALEIRSVAYLVCAVWLSLDVGVELHKRHKSNQTKIAIFCVASCLCFCGAMYGMDWTLSSFLDDQRQDAARNMVAEMNVSGDNLFDSVVTVRDQIESPPLYIDTLACFVNRITNPAGGTIQNEAGEVLRPEEIPLSVSGRSDSCLKGVEKFMRRQRHIQKLVLPDCGDVTVQVYFHLSSQPEAMMMKDFRFATNTGFKETMGTPLKWYSQPDGSRIEYCLTTSER